MENLMIVKRSGEIVEFDSNRVKSVILKAATATGFTLSDEIVSKMVGDIIAEVGERFTDFYPNVENMQDLVEKHLVLNGLYEIAKAYILYRAKRQKEREAEKAKNIEKFLHGKLTIRKKDGRLVLFNVQKVRDTIKRASQGYEEAVDGNAISLLTKEVVKNLYDGATTSDIEDALVLATISFMEKDPGYNFISARLFLQKVYKEVFEISVEQEGFEKVYRTSFIDNIKRGIKEGFLNEKLLDYDLVRMSHELKIERDQLFGYMGIRSLYDRYFASSGENKIETPQAFWMRVAMGLAMNETNREERAIEFYNIISSFRYMPSTPTLFHSGSVHPQMSSCYLTTINDDLSHIFKCVGDNAQMSKWSGGIANDWTNIRATNSVIESTKAASQGVTPFLKIANDVTVINKTGKRRGGTCAYLETWHLDIEEYLELRKNTGDERRRTHDMNTANWIPDLFMKRVLNDEDWTLFSPSDVPDLHHIYGRKFEKRYVEYEEKAKRGEMKQFKSIAAKKLWRKMISMLFETGHPWMTFKDPCNIRSPQDHMGVIHSSNLCTEITLNTSEDETAVCNLGSINLTMHIKDGKIDEEKLAYTIKCAMRMLDNVIDINFYPTIEGKNSNLRHRPVGLGVMGLQDAFYILDIDFESSRALEFNEKIMEFISYHAIMGSSELAKERGAYSSFKGSKWDRGIFPVDTIKLLEEERGMGVGYSCNETLDWTPVRQHVKLYGMRNSNTMAIAPTATISNVVGCYPSIEPIYKNLYVKANVSGEFTVVNSYLITDLKKLGMWNQEMLEQIKYYDGSIQRIAGIPENVRAKYKEAFELSPESVIKLGAARGKWIDQSQSLNIFFKGTSGSRLHEVYTYAWKMGLKTTYYLRSLGVSQIEKSTLDTKYGFTQKREYEELGSTIAAETEKLISVSPGGIVRGYEEQAKLPLNRENDRPSVTPIPAGLLPKHPSQQTLNNKSVKACLLDNPECESCQ